MIQLITTEDNSHTILNTETGEHYHSIHGAIQESKYIFIDKGLNSLQSISPNITILEIGFGTGLNALLTLNEVSDKNLKINYIAIEPFPITQEIYSQLNYNELISNNSKENKLLEIHELSWNFPNYVGENFILNKIEAKLEEIDFQENSFDLVYFDAFSPQIQPELWTEEIFCKLYNAMKNKAILTTYCAKGDVKRAMIKAGFKIELLPGPIGKRHILRAGKEIEIGCCNHHSH